MMYITSNVNPVFQLGAKISCNTIEIWSKTGTVVNFLEQPKYQFDFNKEQDK